MKRQQHDAELPYCLSVCAILSPLSSFQTKHAFGMCSVWNELKDEMKSTHAQATKRRQNTWHGWTHAKSMLTKVVCDGGGSGAKGRQIFEKRRANVFKKAYNRSYMDMYKRYEPKSEPFCGFPKIWSKKKFSYRFHVLFKAVMRL